MIINTNIAMNNKQNYTAPEMERVMIDTRSIVMASPGAGAETMSRTAGEWADSE